jgi:ATP-dependent helicase/nuclease subunit A
VTTRIVSASAGSGKTHRIAEELKAALSSADSPVPPENVLATTFTNKAAAELQERARRYLLEQGRTADAQRLGAARIGTVNSVCGQLVSDFAFELGLPPEQRVLDEQAAAVALRQALSAVISVEESLEISELRERLPYFHVLEAVRRIIELGRANEIAPEDFTTCAERSAAELARLLDTPDPHPETLERGLREALESFVSTTPPEVDPTQKTASLRERIVKNLGRLRAGRAVSWDEWAALSWAESGARARIATATVNVAAEAYLKHPAFRADLERVIELVFDLARRGLEVYGQHKRAAGVLDFVDQETQALRLLERSDIRERLKDDLGLVFVDEFQDTSPLQLAIFLQLAELVPRSLWVGDQKQSIFGFRGSDPELMEAAITELTGQGGVDSLRESWRSRPGLVRLTSDLFACAFARSGMPEERVRLVPAPPLRQELPGLGPFLERWRLKVSNQQEDPVALAGALRQMLADPSVCVRDRLSGAVRRVEPGDVAILCRRNSMARAVAQALGNAGVPAVVPRSRLLATPEGQLVQLGLRLWADPLDRVAAAAIARLTEFAGEDDRWLTAALTKRGAQAFFEMPLVQRLLARRGELLHAGPTAAVVEILEVRRLCADWGDTEQRIANLDALRSLAVAFCQAALAEGKGATVAGLVHHFETARRDGSDGQATLSRGAVSVSTWHAAKGLEWPIVVLFQLDAEHDPSIFGITVERDDGPFDLRNPLAGRRIRLWPMIFHPARRRTTFHERLDAEDLAARAKVRRDAEELRLLYVGWTRARDRIVLAGRPTRLLEGILRHLAGPDGKPLLKDEDSFLTRWMDHGLEIPQRMAEFERPVRPATSPGAIHQAAGRRLHAPAWEQPSSAAGTAVAGLPEKLGERLKLAGQWDENRLGDVLHRFLAADDPSLDAAERSRSARGLLTRWGLSGVLSETDLVAIGDRLWTWLDQRLPGAALHRELPVYLRGENGTVLQGVADLVVETSDALFLVDYKSAGGTTFTDPAAVAGFAGQLEAYSRGLEAALVKPCRGMFVYLPLSGFLVPLGAGEAQLELFTVSSRTNE